jgi:putative ABC transport system substrate-binding protein
LGWIAGRNVRIEYRFAGGVLEQLSMLAKEVSDLHPDVIVALNTPTVAFVLRETRTIPIVFGWVADPVGGGFVQSYARPGGNATGVAFGGENLASKWLELLKEISPETNRAQFSSIPMPHLGTESITCILSRTLLPYLQ